MLNYSHTLCQSILKKEIIWMVYIIFLAEKNSIQPWMNLTDICQYQFCTLVRWGWWLMVILPVVSTLGTSPVFIGIQPGSPGYQGFMLTVTPPKTEERRYWHRGANYFLNGIMQQQPSAHLRQKQTKHDHELVWTILYHVIQKSNSILGPLSVMGNYFRYFEAWFRRVL